MDWYSRKVLAWRLSNSMDADFCVEALKDALAKHGKPEIFNTDQGSQFTSGDWVDVLTDAKIKVSMDGKGRSIDNRMIERLWRAPQAHIPQATRRLCAPKCRACVIFQHVNGGEGGGSWITRRVQMNG
jgi:transposase InsO family protein